MFQKMQPMTSEALEERRLRQQAKRNVMQAQFFRMHFLTYMLINMMIAIINVVVSPDYYFFAWVATGWGLLLMVHIFVYTDNRRAKPAGFFATNIYYFLVFNAYLLFVDTFDGKGFSDPVDFAFDVAMIWGGCILLLWIFTYYWSLESVQEEMRTSRKPDLLKKPVIVTNVLAYVIFNGIAILSDVLFQMEIRWYMWTIVGWGMLILIQILISALYGVLKLSVGGYLIFVHTIAYFGVSILLLLIDMFDGVGFSDPVVWAVIPIGFWGAFYILHIIVYVVWFRGPSGEEVDKEYERLKAQRQQQRP